MARQGIFRFVVWLSIGLWAAAAEAGTLRVAVLADFPPLYQKQTRGVPSGFAMDALEVISKDAGFDYEVVVVKNWREALDAVRQGRADFVPGIGVTPERAKEFVYSSLIETVPISVFVRSGNEQIQSLADVKEHGVGVLKDSAGAELLHERGHPGFIEYTTLEESLFALLAGEVDALVFPESVIKKKLAEIELSARFKTVGSPLLDLRRAYLFPKHQQQFVEQRVNPAIRRLLSSPKYAELQRKWYGPPPRFWTVRTIGIAAGLALALAGIVFYVAWSITIRSKNRRLQQMLEEQKRAEQALKESESRYRILFEQAPLGIAVADSNKALRFVNGPFRALFGYTEEECLARSALTLHPESELHFVEQAFARIGEGQVITVEALGCLRKDGTLFHCDIQVAPMIINAAPAVVGFFTDVTEKLRILREARQNERLAVIGQLAGGVAHDFNNQLTGVLGYAELLREELTELPEQHESVMAIIKAVKRASALTRQLLAFARKGRYELRSVDLHGIIRDTVDLLGHTLDKRISIESLFEAREPWIHGDSSQLQNAFLNLGLNAKDAMPDGGILRFSTARVELPRGQVRKPGDYVRIQVSDTGQGMSAEVLSHAFEPFFTTKAPGQGTGMGLAAVYGTVTSHNGYVDIESQLGHGTTITILLPAINPPTTATEPAEVAPSAATMARHRVLLVDDEQDVRDVAMRMLTKAGLDVAVARDGLAALEYLEKHSRDVDLVILDMIMPRMDGRATFHRIRALRSDIKVLVSSGYTTEAAASELLTEGVAGILHKPYQRSELLHTVQSVLSTL